MPRLTAAVVLYLIAAAPVGAADPLGPVSPARLDALFRAGTPGIVPAGAYRGRVVWVDDALLPRVKARTQSLAWRGKRFHGDGTFVNRFPGFEALPATGQLGTSWADGGPAYVLEYKPGTPLFGHNRDELREVSPGVWLGKVFDTRTPGAGGSWFVLTPVGR